MAIINVSNFIQSICSFITSVAVQMHEVLKISSLIGSYIVCCTIECAVSLHTLITVIYHVSKILFYDFIIFLQDIEKICAFCFEGTRILLSTILDALLDSLMYVFDLTVKICILPVFMYYLVISYIENVFIFVMTGAELFKRAIILIGTGIWLSLMLIPYSLIYIVRYIALVLVYLTNLVCETFSTFLCNVTFGLFNGVIKVGYFFTDIPYEAFAGLITGIIMLLLIYKKRNIATYYGIRAYHLHLRALTVLIQLVRVPCQQFIRQIHLYRHMSRRGSRAEENGNANNEVFQENRAGFSNSSTSSHSGGSKEWIKLQKKLEKEIEEKLCSVCQERRKSVIVLPCRHLCMCVDCVDVIKRVSRKCPLCRCIITRTLNVYM